MFAYVDIRDIFKFHNNRMMYLFRTAQFKVRTKILNIYYKNKNIFQDLEYFNEKYNTILTAINFAKKKYFVHCGGKTNDIKHALIASRTMEFPNYDIINFKDELGVVPIKTI